MNEKEKVRAAVKEIHVKQVISALLRKSWLVALTGIVCAVLTFVGSFYLITPKYESAVLFYVNNSTLSISGAVISAGDLTARQDLVDSYIVILESRETLLDVIDYSGVNRSDAEVRGMVSAASVNGTEIFQVVVESPDPLEAHRIAVAIEEILPNRIKTIIDGSSAEVVDGPIVAQEPSSPNYFLNTVIGFLLGLLVSIGVLVVYELFDVIIRSEEDVQQICSHPVLAAVPDMTVQTKGGYYSGTGRKHALVLGSDKETALVGEKISFAASEAYKLLRTKLQFSFTDGKNCHVIGVTSSMAGEGKSLSSANLAFSLAQLNKRVLLIDCDMRRPSLNTKLNIKKVPGLSNFLTRQVTLNEVVKTYSAGDCAFDVIAAGRNPPNPIELLSSDGMKDALEMFRDDYDYVILDLPPLGEVSDALVAATMVDGVLMVVRQNYCNSKALSTAINQFDFVGGRVLGIILNCTAEGGGSYRYRGKGMRGYQNRYEGSYINVRRAEQEDKS